MLAIDAYGEELAVPLAELRAWNIYFRTDRSVAVTITFCLSQIYSRSGFSSLTNSVTAKWKVYILSAR